MPVFQDTRSRPNKSVSLLPIDEEDGIDSKTVVGLSVPDFSDESTVLSVAANASPFQIRVIEGADAGRKLAVPSNGILLGRGDGCDLQLQDSAASRRHAQLFLKNGRLFVCDLGSGNGTKINGVPIAAQQNHPVRPGDAITIGLSVIQIEDTNRDRMGPGSPDPRRSRPSKSQQQLAVRPPPPPPPSAAPSVVINSVSGEEYVQAQLEERRRKQQEANSPAAVLGKRLRGTTKRQRRIALGVLGFLLLALWSKSFINDYLEKKRQEEIALQKKMEDDRNASFDIAVRDGKNALFAHRPTEALKKFQEATEIAPERAKEIDRHMKTAERDIRAETVFNRAKTLLASQKYEEALNTLKEIDSTSSVSELVPGLKETIEKEALETRKKEVDQLLLALTEESLDQARIKITELPTMERVLYEKRLEEAQQELQANALQSAKNAKERERLQKIQAQNRRASEVHEAIAPIVAKINNADFNSALKLLDKYNTKGKPAHVVQKISLLKKELPKFKKDYSTGNSHYLAKKFELAADPLARALQSWRRMDINGTMGKSLLDHTVEALEKKGSVALQRQDYVTAGRSFKEALKYKPGSKPSQNGLSEITRKAKDVYLQGYTEMRGNPARARQLFEQVIIMTPSDSEVHRNAQNRKKEMERGF